MGLFEKIISLIINFTLIFEPLAIRIPLTPTQAQQDQQLEFEVEIVPVSSGITDVFGPLGNYYCNPLEANVFSPSLYTSSTISSTTATVVEKVKKKLENPNEGCETVWPQLLLRFIANTSSSALEDIFNSISTTTISLTIDLNFTTDAEQIESRTINLEYNYDKSNRYYIKSSDATNIELWWHLGGSTPVIREWFFSKDQSFFDAYITFRSQYYLRDDPFLDSLVEYNYQTGSSSLKDLNKPDSKKRFILKGVNLELKKPQGSENITIKEVRFFKDVLSYFEYLEKIEDKPTLKFTTTTFNIIGFFPTFIESLPFDAPSFVENNLCSYYQEKGGALYLIPFQHSAVWDILVGNVGDCSKPPKFKYGISSSSTDVENLCFRYTNKFNKCDITAGDASTSTSICSVGLKFYQKFFNALIYVKDQNEEKSYLYWNPFRKKDYNILREINEKPQKEFPNFLALRNATNSKKLQDWKNAYSENINYFLTKKRIFTFSTLQYVTSSNLVYTVNVPRDCTEKGEKVVAEVAAQHGGVTTDVWPIYAPVYECNTPGGIVELAISPEDYKPSSTAVCTEYIPWGSLIDGCNSNFFILYNSDYSSFASFLQTYQPIVTTTDTSTPPSGIIFIINTSSIVIPGISKYEYKLIDFVPRIYTDYPTVYTHYFISPESLKTDRPYLYTYSPSWYFKPSFGSFESFTSQCTLPQYGFNVSLYIVPPSDVQIVTTTECTYAGHQERCEEKTYPISVPSQCYGSNLTTATATIDAKYDIIYFTQKYEEGTPEQRLEILLDTNAALTEYRKGNNVAKIEFNILKKGENDILNIGSVSYRRKYIPPPTLSALQKSLTASSVIEYVQEIGGQAPDEIKQQANYIKDGLLREVFSYLPIILDKEKVNSSNLVNLDAVNDSLTLKWYNAGATIGGKEEEIPWIIVFGMSLMSAAKFFQDVAQVLGFLSYLPGLQQIAALVKAIATVFYVAALVVQSIAYLTKPEWSRRIYGDWGNLFIRAAILATSHYIGIELKSVNEKLFNTISESLTYAQTAIRLYESISGKEIGLLVDPNFKLILDMFNLAKPFGKKALEVIDFTLELFGIKYLFEDISSLAASALRFVNDLRVLERFVSPEGLEKIKSTKEPRIEKMRTKSPSQISTTKIDPEKISTENKQYNEVTKVKDAGVSDYAKILVPLQTFMRVAGGVLNAINAYNSFKQMWGLTGPLTKEEKRTLRTYWLESLNVSYGYRLENIKVPVDNTSKILIPVFSLYGVPVYDPLYPEYGFYEPVSNFFGEPVEVKSKCERVECSISTSTSYLGELTVTASGTSDYSQILGGTITTSSQSKECSSPWLFVASSSVTTPTTQLTSSTSVIMPHGSSSMIGISFVGEKFYAEMNASTTEGQTIFNKYIFSDGRDNFSYSFIKSKESTTTISINSFTQYPTTTRRSYTCGLQNYSGAYALFRVSSTKSYTLNCQDGKVPKFKGIDTYNTCLGWKCEYDPDNQPSLTTTPSQ